MPTENAQKVDDLIDVGEADQKATEINLDDKGEPEKVEAPVEAPAAEVPADANI